LSDCWRGVREEGRVARRVEVDEERALLDPLGYGEGRDAERDAWVGLLAETGGVREGASPARRDRLSAFSEAGDSPERERAGRRLSGVKGLGDGGVEAEIELLDLLGKDHI